VITINYFNLNYLYVVNALTTWFSVFIEPLGITLTTFIKIYMGYISNRVYGILQKVVKVVKVINYSSVTPTASSTYIVNHRNKVITY
jgi:hypothetical protein